MPPTSTTSIATSRNHVWLAASAIYGGDMRAPSPRARALAQRTRLPLLAINDVLMHAPERRPLADVAHLHPRAATLDAAGRRLAANAERHLKSAGRDGAPLRATRRRRSRRRSRFLDALDFSPRRARATNIPTNCAKASPASRRRSTHLALRGRAQRAIRTACRDAVRRRLAHELALIARAATTRPISSPSTTSCASRAREDILCQGRGSAANSARLLLPRHHRGRSGAARSPVRALHLGRAQRAARHRRRFRA